MDVELLQINTQQIIDLGAKYSRSVTATVVRAGSGATTAVTQPPERDQVARDQRLHVHGPAITFNFIEGQHGRRAARRRSYSPRARAQLVIGDRVLIRHVDQRSRPSADGRHPDHVVPVPGRRHQDRYEPRVHHNKEVSLKLTIEVSQLNGRFRRGWHVAADHRRARSRLDPPQGRRDELPRRPHSQGHLQDEELHPVPRRPPAHRHPLQRRQDGQHPDGCLPDADAAHHPVAADHGRGPHPDLGGHGEQRVLLGPQHAPRIPERDGLAVRRAGAGRGSPRRPEARRRTGFDDAGDSAGRDAERPVQAQRTRPCAGPGAAAARAVRLRRPARRPRPPRPRPSRAPRRRTRRTRPSRRPRTPTPYRPAPRSRSRRCPPRSGPERSPS